ncbi:hypothetical protein FGO68_gene6907 [Halteria grandinella]|uniref:Secreted protein n=1 Tax=Halteria grandinella TaxID=5974 RepID=A0A8J8P4M5_HALGN|nr:hypothetical protein FGO68_gene6907 [Halteria grandinella]
MFKKCSIFLRILLLLFTKRNHSSVQSGLRGRRRPAVSPMSSSETPSSFIVFTTCVQTRSNSLLPMPLPEWAFFMSLPWYSEGPPVANVRKAFCIAFWWSLSVFLKKSVRSGSVKILAYMPSTTA